ncbi:MAG: helix-turn-helix transcriptional regulator [Candidatus Thiodiazotropha endolucinida]
MPEKLENCIEFGQRIRNLRKEKGYSQESFADHANIHRTYMGGIERGERNPTLTTIYRLAEALEVDPSELLKSDD